MGRRPSLIWEGGGFNELMRPESLRIQDTSPYYTDYSVPSGHVLISVAVVACAQGGVENVTNRRKG